jgi:enoyl-CoA hydratase/carnithine racemase
VPHYETLAYETGDKVATITFNRPERRNALDTQVCGELIDAMHTAEADPDVLCVVLTGSGKVFCAGQNLKFTLSSDPQAYDEYRRINRRMRDTIQRLDKPVIAKVQGDAIGGGTYIATCCDLIVAVPDARFAMREINAGIHSGGAHLFTIGRARSIEMNMLGRHVDAVEAERWGLINRVAPPEELDAAVNDYVQEILALPPLSVRYTKFATNMLLDMAGYWAWLDAHVGIHPSLSWTEDGKEAKRAFLEKRAPNFTGRISAP